MQGDTIPQKNKKKRIVIYNPKDQEYKTFVGKRPFIMDRDRGNLLSVCIENTLDNLYGVCVDLASKTSYSGKVPMSDEVEDCKQLNDDDEVTRLLKMVSMIERLTELMEEMR